MTDQQQIALQVQDAVRVSGITRSALYVLIAQGKIEARKNGRRTLVLASSLQKFIDELPPLKPSAAQAQAV